MAPFGSWRFGPQARLSLLLCGALAAAPPPPPLEIIASGDCSGGSLPAECTAGELGSVNWHALLRVVCSTEVRQSETVSPILDTLALFDAESAKACFDGFLTTFLALLVSGLREWRNQVVRYVPDGSYRALVGAWDERGEDPVFKRWHTRLPREHTLQPPWPPWKFPGPLAEVRAAQDLSALPQHAAALRCSPAALAAAGCGDDAWLELLYVLCTGCELYENGNGVNCIYTAEHLEIVEAVLRESRNSWRAPPCPHGMLAAILTWLGRAEASPPETDGKLYRVPRAEGGSSLVLHATLRKLADHVDNYFLLNVPIMDLSPFPGHTGMLRSARLNVAKDAEYYQSVVASASAFLSRAGLAHLLLPGDGGEGPWQAPGAKGVRPLCIFLDVALQDAVLAVARDLAEALADEFGGPFRFLRAAAGLWQLGEEPYRFTPQAGAAFRLSCGECVFVSLYFYARGGAGAALPLAPWTPCALPLRRLFPAAWRELQGHRVPFAADEAWLRRAQRRPAVWLPGRDGHQGDAAESCRSQIAAATAAPARTLLQGFDMSAAVLQDLGMFDLMRLREDSELEGLLEFSDKIRFKGRLMKQGIPIPKVHYMSNTPANYTELLQDLGSTSYVAKPTHLAATSFVYVMRDGVNLINGRQTSLQEVADGLTEAWSDRHVDDWATEATAPGVVIEELVGAPERPGGGATPDELKCQTFFGELFFCEWVFVLSMTSGEEGRARFLDAHAAGDRALPGRGHAAGGIPNFVSKGYVFRDRSCWDCAEAVPLSPEGWEELVRIVEAVAAGTDHIRIDVFVTPDGKPLVNEANISFLKISKFPPQLVEEMRRRWLEGYRAFHS